MTAIRAKILEVFRNLKSDAVPKPPRKDKERNGGTKEENNENIDANGGQEPQDETPDISDYTKGYKPKAKNKKGKGGKANPESPETGKGVNTVNTQATGNVFNFMDCHDIHYGNVFVNNFGTSNGQKSPSPSASEETTIQKTNEITLLLEATVKPEHEYIDYISKNMSKNWRDFFVALGYTRGRIETVEYDQAKNGIAEARYQLLLDWVRNDEDGTLGRLATELWEQGEREVVHSLSIIYKKNKK